MIIQHQQFCLLGKKILERAVFQAPMRESRTWEEEACFLYYVKGKLELYGGHRKDRPYLTSRYYHEVWQLPGLIRIS